MQIIKALFRFFIILPFYGLILTLTFSSLVWVILYLFSFISEILTGDKLTWNINQLITAKAVMIAFIFICLGGLLNLIVFIANGFKMPVRGLQTKILLHRPLDSSTRLSWLSDIIPALLDIRVSIGDLFIFSGLAIIVITIFFFLKQ